MSMVSGGKALHIPGITSKKTVVEEPGKTSFPSPAKKRISGWVALCFIAVPLITVSFFINLYYQNLINDAKSQAVGSLAGDGYKMPTAQINLMGIGWPSLVVWVAITALVFVVLLVFTDVFERLFRWPLLIALVLAIFAMLGPDLFAHPVSKNSDDFANWAKEKYSLSSIEKTSTSSSMSTYFNAKEADGRPVRMNVYQTPENIIYLYRSEKELMDILSRNIAAKTNS